MKELEKMSKEIRVCSDCLSKNLVLAGYYPRHFKCGDCGHKGTIIVREVNKDIENQVYR